MQNCIMLKELLLFFVLWSLHLSSSSHSLLNIFPSGSVNCLSLYWSNSFALPWVWLAKWEGTDGTTVIFFPEHSLQIELRMQIKCYVSPVFKTTALSLLMLVFACTSSIWEYNNQWSKVCCYCCCFMAFFNLWILKSGFHLFKGNISKH